MTLRLRRGRMPSMRLPTRSVDERSADERVKTEPQAPTSLRHADSAPRSRTRVVLWSLVTAVALLGWQATWGRAQGDVASGAGSDAAAETLSSDLASSPTSPSARAPGPAKTRTLLDTLLQGGFVGLLIGILSVIAVGFIIEHFMSIRKSVLAPEEVATQLEQLIHDGQIKEAIEAAADPGNESLIADVVLAGLQRFEASDFGFAEYKAAVEEAGEDQTGRLYRKTEVLGIIGAIAPMLGLTGTVLGMIKAFNKIAATGGAAKPEQLADGIGQALVTTLMGLVVAIPAMIAFSYFRIRIDSIVAEAGKRVEQIMMPLGRRK